MADRSVAWALATNAVGLNRDSKIGHFVKGMVTLDQETLAKTDTPERLAAVTAALTRANHDAPAWGDGEVLLELAIACYRAGDTTNATIYEAKAALVPRKPWYYFNTHARFKFAQGSNDLAVADLWKAVELATNSPLAWANLGKVLLKLDHCDQALDCLRKSLRLSPSDYGYDGMGLYFLNLTNQLAANRQAAATNFEAAAEYNPSRYDLPGKAGLAYLELANAAKGMVSMKGSYKVAYNILRRSTALASAAWAWRASRTPRTNSTQRWVARRACWTRLEIS